MCFTYRTIIVIAFVLCSWQRSVAKQVRFHHFPVPKVVEGQVKFWHGIFSQFGTHQIVIHDRDDPQVILDVIDFQLFSERFNNSKAYSEAEKRKIILRYLKRYQLAIKRFKKMGRRALKLGEMEKRVYQVYRKHPKGIRYLYTKKTAIRSQTGLADEFLRASRRAEKYLPYIEDIFRKRSLPVDLPRIAFVESMFNEKAISKVGASGIWQIMPLTGKQFLKLNKFIDERNSPIKASMAAADLLVENFRHLKKWPLAITAYNHGANGIRRATRILGTDRIDRIIRHYKSPSFGFASKNFYGEFLAANIVYKERYRRDYHDRNPLRISKITLRDPISIYELIKHTPLNEDIIKKYNACLRKAAFKNHKYTPLPRNYELIVPEQMQGRILRSVKLIALRNNKKRRFSL